MKMIIAEMACSHEGDMNLARNIIDASANAKADAIQLQIWSADHMMSPLREEFQMLKNIEFTQEQWKALVDYTRDKYPGLLIYVCVYEHMSLEFIASLDIDGYKINSSDLSNPLVLNKIASNGKPVNLSVGASSIEEIQSAVSILRSNPLVEITLMYGFQSFPTEPSKVNLGLIPKLGQLFELPTGYQDHCDANNDSAFWLPAASIGLGINVIEKHITHDRSLKGIDHESALNPDEFIDFVTMIRTLDGAIGDTTPHGFSPEEIKYREFQKKSVVASTTLLENTVLNDEHFLFMRADKVGYSPAEIDKLKGKIVTREIKAYQLIEDSDLS